MQPANSGMNAQHHDGVPTKFLQRIGSTTYVVSVHFSQTNQQTLDDKLLRLIESEARKAG